MASLPPEAELVVAEHQELLFHLFDMLEAGADHTRTYREKSRRTPISPHLEAGMIRSYGIEWSGDGLQDLGYRLRPLLNDGIEISGRSLVLKILKRSREGGIPARGISQKRREWFGQGSLFKTDGGPPQRLVLLYGVDRNGQIAIFDLSCPRSFDDSSVWVDPHWYAPLIELVADRDLPEGLPERGDPLHDVQVPRRVVEPTETGTDGDGLR